LIVDYLINLITGAVAAPWFDLESHKVRTGGYVLWDLDLPMGRLVDSDQWLAE